MMLAHKKNCTGCMACADICPKSAIISVLHNDGHIYPVIDESKCIECHKCSKICTIQTGNLPIHNVCRPYAAWANNRDLRIRSSSGGVFASMAKHFIENYDGYVYGAKLDGVNVSHVCIHDSSSLKDLQGSKYIQGDLSGIYKDVKNKLESGKMVLFSGVPCQIAALHSYLQVEYSNLYTIDLVCGGFPSRNTLQKFMQYYPNTKNIISYRDKRNGWKSKNYAYNFTVEDNLGKLCEFGTENLVTMAFGASITHRHSCYNCRFVGLHRCSDITIGDFWGDENFKEQHYDGVSVVFTHTKKGLNLLSESNITYHLVSVKDAICKNLAVVNGRKYSRYNPFRIYMIKLYERCSYDEILDVLKGKGYLGMLYRICSVMLSKIQNLRKLYVYKSIARNEKD